MVCSGTLGVPMQVAAECVCAASSALRMVCNCVHLSDWWRVQVFQQVLTRIAPTGGGACVSVLSAAPPRLTHWGTRVVMLCDGGPALPRLV